MRSTTRSATSASTTASRASRVKRVKVLVTSSRMPFALDVIRKLGESGHEVFACDSYGASPGSHSKYLAKHFTTASATGDPAQFASDVERIAAVNEIEIVIPMFEEVF